MPSVASASASVAELAAALPALAAALVALAAAGGADSGGGAHGGPMMASSSLAVHGSSGGAHGGANVGVVAVPDGGGRFATWHPMVRGSTTGDADAVNLAIIICTAILSAADCGPLRSLPSPAGPQVGTARRCIGNRSDRCARHRCSGSRNNGSCRCNGKRVGWHTRGPLSAACVRRMAPNGYFGRAAPGWPDMDTDARSSRGWNGGAAESRALAAAAAMVEAPLAKLLKLQLQREMRVVDGDGPGGSIL